MTNNNIHDIQKDPDSIHSAQTEADQELIVSCNDNENSADFENIENQSHDVHQQISDLQKQLAVMEENLAETKNNYLLALANAENSRNLADKRIHDFKKYAIAGFMKDLLSNLDNLDRALDVSQKSSLQENSSHELLKTVVDGIEMTKKLIADTFKKHHVIAIEALGNPFDPNIHQALQEVPKTDEFPENTVTSVLQEGYLLHDRLLRPAMVVIAK